MRYRYNPQRFINLQRGALLLLSDIKIMQLCNYNFPQQNMRAFQGKSFWVIVAILEQLAVLAIFAMLLFLCNVHFTGREKMYSRNLLPPNDFALSRKNFVPLARCERLHIPFH